MAGCLWWDSSSSPMHFAFCNVCCDACICYRICHCRLPVVGFMLESYAICFLQHVLLCYAQSTLA